MLFIVTDTKFITGFEAPNLNIYDVENLDRLWKNSDYFKFEGKPITNTENSFTSIIIKDKLTAFIWNKQIEQLVMYHYGNYCGTLDRSNYVLGLRLLRYFDDIDFLRTIVTYTPKTHILNTDFYKTLAYGLKSVTQIKSWLQQLQKGVYPALYVVKCPLTTNQRDGYEYRIHITKTEFISLVIKQMSDKAYHLQHIFFQPSSLISASTNLPVSERNLVKLFNTYTLAQWQDFVKCNIEIYDVHTAFLCGNSFSIPTMVQILLKYPHIVKVAKFREYIAQVLKELEIITTNNK